MKKILIQFCTLVFLGLAISLSTLAVQPGARILLESYEIIEGEVAAGEQVTLRFTFQNISANASAVGILITYGTGNSDIVPVYSASNQIYIPYLSAGEHYVQEVSCQVLSRQDYSTAQVYFTATYRDDVAGSGSNDFMIAIPLESQAKLKIQNTTLPAEFRAQTQTTGHLNILNEGENDAREVVLHCQGAVQQAQQTIELGDLAGGESMGIDFNLTFLEEGEQTLSIWLEFQDENGVSNQTEPVVSSVTVQPAVGVEDMLASKNETNSSQSLWSLAIVAVLALIFLLGVWGYRKNRKRNKFVD